MFYKVEYQKRAHQEVEKIFRVLFPEQGLAVREEQIRLCPKCWILCWENRLPCVMQGWGLGRPCLSGSLRIIAEDSMLTGRGNSLEQRPG